MAPPGLSPTETGLEPAQRPHLGDIIRRVAQSLLVACFVPIAIFYAFFVTTGVWTAMIAALGWAYGAIAFRALTGRTAIALAADSTFLYFLQPVISDAVVGATFLLSLASARPMVARLAGDFYPMDRGSAASRVSEAAHGPRSSAVTRGLPRWSRTKSTSGQRATRSTTSSSWC